MIDKGIYDLDYIRELQARYKTDPGLLERGLAQGNRYTGNT